MSVEWGIAELRLRDQDAREAASDASWEMFCDMKWRWARRRKAAGFTKGQAKHWLAIASARQDVNEKQMESVYG